MKGKKSPQSQWVMDYLRSQGVDTSSWESYGLLHVRYMARIKKYNPQNYQQFINLCTFHKQRKQNCGPEDLGDWSKELGGWKKKAGPKEPKEPKPSTYKPVFNEERWWRDQKKEFSDWKLRMKRYREDKIRNQRQQGETGRMKDFLPYAFKLALKTLAGVYPEECYPETLNDYKGELQSLLDEQRKVFKEL